MKYYLIVGALALACLLSGCDETDMSLRLRFNKKAETTNIRSMLSYEQQLELARAGVLSAVE